MQTTVIPQWTTLKLGAAGQRSQNPHFQLLEGRTETNSKLKQKALAHSMAWKRHYCCWTRGRVGEVRVWGTVGDPQDN